MKIVFYINYLNHHQVAITDELYNCLGEDFLCVCTKQPAPSKLKGGKDYSNRTYCINSTSNSDSHICALYYARTADVCVFGGDSMEFAIERAKHNDSGLSFEMSERWLKMGIINICSPRLIKNLWCYYKYFRKRKFNKLCASAYAARDQYLMHTYRERCYKWGYFTDTEHLDVENSIDLRRTSVIKIMWCARFLKWKHPELPVKLAAFLKAKGCKFTIDMYGSGKELDRVKSLAVKLGVTDVLTFCGNLPNVQILDQMRKHDIFLFTSDRNEGWGVVANEAMSCGCVLVGADAIGSVPFLLKDGENGCVYKSCDVESLISKVEYLIDNPYEMKRMAINGYHTITNIWSPRNAVSNLLKLISDLQSGSDTSILDGPCSKALPL